MSSDVTSTRPRAKSKDPAWKYSFWPNTNNRNCVECELCGKQFNGGINRIKQHLVGIGGNARKCEKVTREIVIEISNYMQKNKRKRSNIEMVVDKNCSKGAFTSNDNCRRVGVISEGKELVRDGGSCSKTTKVVVPTGKRALVELAEGLQLVKKALWVKTVAGKGAKTNILDKVAIDEAKHSISLGLEAAIDDVTCVSATLAEAMDDEIFDLELPDVDLQEESLGISVTNNCPVDDAGDDEAEERKLSPRKKMLVRMRLNKTVPLVARELVVEAGGSGLAISKSREVEGAISVSAKAMGLWRGHVVQESDAELLRVVEEQYPITFEGLRVRTEKVWVVYLTQFCDVVGRFINASVSDLSQEALLVLQEDLDELENFGFDMTWAMKRLRRVNELKFKNPLRRELSVLRQGLETLRDEVDYADTAYEAACAASKDAHERYAKGEMACKAKETEVAVRFRGDGDQLLASSLGLGLLPRYRPLRFG